jgi:signal transduction histidine kinase
MPDKRIDRAMELSAPELARAIQQLEIQNREMRADREHIARMLVDEHRKRESSQHFLSDAGAILAASLDYDTTLSTIARVAVPYLADCAVVDIVRPDQTIRRAAVFHRNPVEEQLLWDLDKFMGFDVTFGRGKVVRTGRPEFYSVVSADLEAAIASNPEHLNILRQLRWKSFICVPMKSRGATTGAIGLMRQAGSDSYTSSDLALAENFADRAGLALDNASLFRREQEANRVKDEFLSTVSHELRTPLTPILGAAYVLRTRCADRPDLTAAIDVIERNAKRQARIVEDLFDISKIAKGVFELTILPSDLHEVVEHAVELVRPGAEALGIRFEIDLGAIGPPVPCDPDRIQQALLNLLSNAIKFTPPGGRIAVRLQRGVKSVRISVSDTGTGIGGEFLPLVFERFRQADRFNTRGAGGLGVGLSIVRHIVEKHGGSVHAESPGAGLGAVFTIELPY